MDDLELALAAARAGAEVVAAAFGTEPAPDLKGANDPVTQVDRDSEEAIVATLRRHRPLDAIVAEEGAGSEGSGSRRWFVDPLDGTVNFVHGIPQVSVSVALYDGDVALAGVVVDPLRGETFAVAGDGAATLNGRAIGTSRADGLAGSVIATGFFYDHDRYAAEYTEPMTAVLERANGVRRFGSAALDLAWTACGRFDGYWELGVAPWDIAAGIALVRAAGGRVTDPYGAEATPATRLIVAAAPAAHDELRAVVEEHLPQRLRTGAT